MSIRKSRWMRFSGPAVVLALVVAATGSARAETVAVFDNPAFVDTGGGFSSESDTVQATLELLGNTVTTFTGITAADWTAAGASADLILIPELEVGDLIASLTPDARAAIDDYVRSGGGFVVMGVNGDRDVRLLNGVFGFNVLGSGGVFTQLDPVAAAGTPFEGGPASLGTPSLTISVLIASLPPDSLAFYVSGTRASVFATDLDGGRVGLMGWDWFDAIPLGSEDGGWVDVLGSMVEHVAGSPAPPVDLDASDAFPANLFGLPDSAIGNPLPFDLEDLALAGRTEAFELSLSLGAGRFEVLPSFGSPGSGAGIEIGPALGGGTADEWSVVRVEGGPGDASLRYLVSPPPGAPAVGSGILFSLGTAALSVRDLEAALGTPGGSLGLSVLFASADEDSLPLQRAEVLIARSIEGIEVDATDETLPPEQDGNSFTYRTQDVSVSAQGVCTGFPSASGFPVALNCSADDLFQLDTTNDLVHVDVSGPDLQAVLAAPGFSLAIDGGADCEPSEALASVSGPLPAGQTSVVLSFPPPLPGVARFGLCVETGGIFDGLRSLEVDVAVAFSAIFLTNTDPTGFGVTLSPRCFGDLTGDGRVNNLDLIGFRACYPCAGPGCDPICDSNFDGNVNNLDVLALIETFGSTCPGF